MSSLDARLLSAHGRDDRRALVALYEEAADEAENETARGFYLTHAFVFALELGDSRADTLRARLHEMGRI
ncbi:hypothetical protein [Marimonas arenosa]|uniref:Uncharacterized protein n=1 Tax=Marimonas arenosa TaxID=1795305 RepID=A0AAE4B5W3_9RHOB|nr:hypothetical protein [Marimonas arenosa]MDQ2092403.1 hypothetical protein [Marimonas arenosa]